MLTDWIRGAETVFCSRLRNPGRGDKPHPGHRKRRVKKRKKYQSDAVVIDSKLMDVSTEVVTTILRRLSNDGVADLTHETPPRVQRTKLEQVTSLSSGESKEKSTTSLTSIISANMVCSITSFVALWW